MDVADTIAAIATPGGSGGVGVIRVSGPRVPEIMEQFAGRMLRPRMASLTRFRDDTGGLIDEGLAIYFPSPHSYTGQDVLELQVHGAPVALNRLLHRCFALGARPAEPGEFTKRAFLNGKLDLVQAQGVADLIAARTEQAARSASRSLSGEFSERVSAFQAELTTLRVLIEGSLDFPEEGIDFMRDAGVEARLSALLGAVADTIRAGEAGRLLQDGLCVVLVGPPNAGKSSIINMLCSEDVAIVTPIPGTTRDLVRATVQVEGVPIELVDTAGLRSTPDLIEEIGIERTWQAVSRADVALVVLDAAGAAQLDMALLAQVPQGVRRVWVHNKIDLVGAAPGIKSEESCTHVWISALTGAGCDELRRALLAGQPGYGDTEFAFSARARQLDSLRRCKLAIQRAVGVLDSPELAAEELRSGQAALSEITGELVADDLLGEIFSRFCIGK